MVTFEPLLVQVFTLTLIALAIGIILRYFKQPSVVAYILTGVVIGPFGFNLISDTEVITSLGNFGVVLLLFFVGMEISLKDLIVRWKIAIIGTGLQILLSLFLIAVLGYFLEWAFGWIILVGFVISLSSTAVVLNILEAKKEVKSKIGQDVISILLIQDLAFIPMIIILTNLGGGPVNIQTTFLQIFGCALAMIFIWWLIQKGSVHLPFRKKLRQDKELQLLASFVICLGIALLSGLFQLSTALGAFIAGLYLSSAKETEWVHNSLSSFKVLFLALFFMNIGMMIDFSFLAAHFVIIMEVLFLTYFTNTLINAIIFRVSGESWANSFYGGSILSQIGEFSFILVAIAISVGLINDFAYQLTVIVIALSLLISPFWISFFSRFVKETSAFVRRGNRFVKKVTHL